MLSAVDFINAKGLIEENNILILKLGNPNRVNNFNQMLKLLSVNIHYFSEVNIVTSQSKLSVEYELIRIFLRKKKDIFDIVLCGDFRDYYSQLLYGLTTKRKILIDDGLATPISAIKYYNNTSCLYKKKYNKLIYITYRLLGLKTENFAFSIFTAFPIPNRNMDVEINKPVVKNKRINDNVFFFGQKLSESGFISLKSEVRAIYESKCRYKHKFYYIPHRDDSLEKINLLKDAGITIKSLGMPAEIYFNNQDIIPGTISGFWTSALVTVGLKYNTLAIDCFDIRPYLDVADMSDINTAYQYYNELGLTIVEYHR
ncbi:hypothetical protein CWO29_19600 [Vibrio splendidus]|nr:hypothetical protein CWO29_19600 [Vibrio splendidus]